MPTMDKREEGPRSISASLEPTTLDGGSGACLGAGARLFFFVYANVWSEVRIIFLRFLRDSCLYPGSLAISQESDDSTSVDVSFLHSKKCLGWPPLVDLVLGLPPSLPGI